VKEISISSYEKKEENSNFLDENIFEKFLSYLNKS